MGGAWYLTSLVPRNRLDRPLCAPAPITEPGADRGPRRGSPAGVVDAPDARVNFDIEHFQIHVDFGIRRYRARFCIALTR
jgi:hypothetical protein